MTPLSVVIASESEAIQAKRRPPLFVAADFAESDRSPNERNAVHRDVARVIAETV